MTTTYGYLTDSQFELACSHVARILERHQRDKKHLMEVVKRIQRRLEEAARSLVAVRDYMNYLDRHPPDEMRRDDGLRVVQLHGQDYSGELENQMAAVKRRQEAAERFVAHLGHYTSSAVEGIRTHTEAVELAAARLEEVTEAIRRDTGILRRYVGPIYRLRKALWHH